MVGSFLPNAPYRVFNAGRVCSAQKCSINRLITDFRHIFGSFTGVPHGHSSCALKSLKIDVTGTPNVFSGQFGDKKRVSDVLAPEILMPRSGTRIWCGELCAVIFIESPHFE